MVREPHHQKPPDRSTMLTPTAHTQALTYQRCHIPDHTQTTRTGHGALVAQRAPHIQGLQPLSMPDRSRTQPGITHQAQPLPQGADSHTQPDRVHGAYNEGKWHHVHLPPMPIPGLTRDIPLRCLPPYRDLPDVAPLPPRPARTHHTGT
jgi:hypothetical protein